MTKAKWFWFVTLHEPQADGTVKRRGFTLDNPVGYRKRVSWASFRSRELHRAYGVSAKVRKGLTMGQYADSIKHCVTDVVVRDTDSVIYKNLAADAPFEKHFEDLWDFYTFINYDRESKKYL